MTIAAKAKPVTVGINTPGTTLDELRTIAGRIAFTTAVVCVASSLAPYPRAAPVLGTLAVILCFIFLFPRIAGLPSHVWGPVLGAAALFLVSQAPVAALGIEVPELGWGIVWEELTGHLGVPILILSFAYLSISLDDSGFFNWCSLKLMRAGRGSGRRLIVSVFLGVSLLTFFTSNDIVILSITPILIYLGNHARIRNLVPLLTTQFIAANTASMGLYIGNPTNIVIGNAVGMGFLQYSQRMLLPTLVATVVTLVLVWVIFTRFSRSNRIADRYELLPHSDDDCWTRQMTIKVLLFGSCLLLLAVLGNPWLPQQLLGRGDPDAVRDAVSRLIIAVSAAFALLALVVDIISDRAKGRSDTRALRDRMRRMPVEIVPFFLSFCIVLRGFEEADLTRYVVQNVVDAFEHGPLVGSLATGTYAVLAVNLTNNIPATILFEKTWLGSSAATPPIIGVSERLTALDPSYADIFIESCLFGSNFGANLTFIGALAGLMWLRIIHDQARRAPEVLRVPTARDFLTYGAIVVPAVTAATCFVIAISR
jgi:arsenical pump membrane protein